MHEYGGKRAKMQRSEESQTGGVHTAFCTLYDSDPYSLKMLEL